ncbi:MAG: serine hydrolase, partial [Candidatus Omnitrophota bacterium]
MKIKKIFLIIFITALLVSVSFLAYRYYSQAQEAKKQRALFEKRKITWEALRQKLANEISQFKGEAGIVVKDLQTNREIYYNKDKLFPSASLAKIPIMAACFLAAEEGRLKLDRQVALKDSD